MQKKRLMRKNINKDIQRAGFTDPVAFGDLVTCDHEVIAERNPQNQSRHGDKYTVVTQDYFTSWLEGFPVNSKSSDDVLRAFQSFFGPDHQPKVIYSDNSGELMLACKRLGYLHATSTPHLPQTNGIAERSPTCIVIVLKSMLSLAREHRF